MPSTPLPVINTDVTTLTPVKMDGHSLNPGTIGTVVYVGSPDQDEDNIEVEFTDTKDGSVFSIWMRPTELSVIGC